MIGQKFGSFGPTPIPHPAQFLPTTTKITTVNAKLVVIR